MFEYAYCDDRLVFGIGAALYLLSAVIGLYALLRSKAYPRVGLLPFISIAFLVQTIGLNLRGTEVGGCPLGNSFEVAQFICWSAVLLYFIIGPVSRLRLLGLFTASFAGILSAIALLIPAWDAPYLPGRFGGDPWIELHAAMAIFSYGVFTILTLVSGMFLLQQHGLKQKQHRGIYAVLPSVQQLDIMAKRLLLTGVFCLSAALIFGALFWIENPERVPIFKLSVTGFVWVGYFTVAMLRLQNRLVTRRQAYAVILLFLLALLSLWPVQTAREPAQVPHVEEPTIAS